MKIIVWIVSPPRTTTALIPSNTTTGEQFLVRLGVTPVLALGLSFALGCGGEGVPQTPPLVDPTSVSGRTGFNTYATANQELGDDFARAVNLTAGLKSSFVRSDMQWLDFHDYRDYENNGYSTAQTPRWLARMQKVIQSGQTPFITLKTDFREPDGAKFEWPRNAFWRASFVDFVSNGLATFAQRFPQVTPIVMISNEPSNSPDWNNPTYRQSYAQIVRDLRQRLNSDGRRVVLLLSSVNNNSSLIRPHAFSNYLQWARSEGLDDLVDGYSVHTYLGSVTGSFPEENIEEVNQFATAAGKPVFATELGYNSVGYRNNYHGSGVTELIWAKRIFLSSLLFDTKANIFYEVRDRLDAPDYIFTPGSGFCRGLDAGKGCAFEGGGNEASYGFYEQDLDPKPTAIWLQRFMELYGNWSRDSGGRDSANPNHWWIRLRSPRGETITIRWSQNQSAATTDAPFDPVVPGVS
ncbi:MAG: hypothetical protein LCH41_02650 [Armatimonadetes bacterium]|nr:hypothetical protein [Armatimonadota bacterium]